jgi:hypothetical protein
VIRVALLGSLETFCLQMVVSTMVSKYNEVSSNSTSRKGKRPDNQTNGVHSEKKTRGQQWISTNFEHKRKDKRCALVLHESGIDNAALLFFSRDS